MPARAIPHRQWSWCLGNFGYRHFAREVILEQRWPSQGRNITINHHFLQELATDCTGGHEQITIVLGAPFEPHKTLVVPNPKHVRLAAGREHALEIDADDGRTVVVQVRRA